MSESLLLAGEQSLLAGELGELLFVRYSVDPRLLEDALEALAQAPFPINPELHHSERRTIVEFPAYAEQVPRLESTLRAHGLDVAALSLHRMAEELRPR